MAIVTRELGDMPLAVSRLKRSIGTTDRNRPECRIELLPALLGLKPDAACGRRNWHYLKLVLDPLHWRYGLARLVREPRRNRLRECRHAAPKAAILVYTTRFFG